MKDRVAIKWMETVDSTQNEVQRQQDGLDNLSVVAARNQTAGRGQRGNRWKTRPGENLTFSILLLPGRDGIPAIPAGDQFVISEIVTLALHTTLEDAGIPSKIKWPNDIYVGDRKICGVLIENTLQGGMVHSSIIGIGLNVNQTEFDPEVMNPTSMKNLTGRTFDLQELLVLFMDCFRDELSKLTQRRITRVRYLSALYRFGTQHSYTDCATETVFEGKITGISQQGLLCVEMPDGIIREFGFKEISYII